MRPLLFLIFILIFSGQAGAQPSGEAKILAQGLQLEEERNYEGALKTWSEGLTRLETPSFAIALEYIRVVTEQKMRSRYETASVMYQWGLSAGVVDPNKEALSRELEMLKPITGEQWYGESVQLLEKGDTQLYNRLLHFWQSQDPTPVTNYNERLMEHWERIAYARENFIKNEILPYGTDERGAVYVQYGKPDRKIEGQLRASQGDVAVVCRTTNLPCDPDIMANVVSSLHDEPYYEIWIYKRPNNRMKYNLVYIFGENPLSGFGWIQTIDDFIPSRAFTFSDRYTYPSLNSGVKINPGEKVTPGMLMQWLYYRQLSAQDFYFADQFSRMDFEWNRNVPDNPYLGKYAGPMKEQQHQIATISNLNKAPDEISTYEKIFPEIPVEVYQYRLLNEQNQPIFVTFLESRPQQVFIEDLAANQDRMSQDPEAVETIFKNYKLIHGMQVKDPSGRILSQIRMPATLVFDSTNTEPSSSVFTVPLLARNQQQLMYVELHNTHPNTKPKIESPFPNFLRGMGKIMPEQPEPLYSYRQELIMSDLILGYQLRTEDTDALFPFVVANNRKIPLGEDLAMHFQVYHLKSGLNGIAHFKLKYEIVPVSFLGWTQERKNKVSLTLNFETEHNRYSENLEIRTRILKPGKYELRLQVADQISGQQLKRELKFEVIE